jgi:Tol biopolymer transport system component
MRRALILIASSSMIAVALACGETLVEPADVPDASADVVALSDALSDATASDVIDIPFDAAAPCRLDLPFANVRVLPGAINTGDHEVLGRLTADEKTIVYAAQSIGGGPASFFWATRESTAIPFPAGTPIPGWQVGDNDPAVSDDGLRLYFMSDTRPDAASFDIYVSTRSGPDASFGTPVNIGPPNTFQVEFHPFERAGGLWFASVRGSQTRDIFFAAGGGATFGEASKVEVSLEGVNDQLPTPSVDGLTLYFASDRPSGDAGHADTWVARRANATGKFLSPQRVDEVATAGELNRPSWLSVDGCRLYFESNRSGNFDIYIAEKPPKN